jgi:hypothetical protein
VYALKFVYILAMSRGGRSDDALPSTLLPHIDRTLHHGSSLFALTPISTIAATNIRNILFDAPLLGFDRIQLPALMHAL